MPSILFAISLLATVEKLLQGKAAMWKPQSLFESI
jgi:hypothetical protein